MTVEDTLSPEQATRVADAVEDIETNVSRLRSYQSLSRDQYLSAEYRETREAVEREFEKLTAAVVDIAQTILKAEGIAVPDHRKATVDELETLGILDSALAQKLRDAIGFRDVLAHSYGPIVNDDIVYDALQNSLERYVLFVEAIAEYLAATD
jgi:uncharacterized protein YutE (UPF0331/DUF86 family)